MELRYAGMTTPDLVAPPPVPDHLPAMTSCSLLAFCFGCVMSPHNTRLACKLLLLYLFTQAMDHIVNSAAKTLYMSAGKRPASWRTFFHFMRTYVSPAAASFLILSAGAARRMLYMQQQELCRKGLAGGCSVWGAV